ncbi:hypothetical protein UNH65_06775 [Chitinophaga sp. 180180018-2]|nr:hypothetical protein [Chitinophaga sp. 212800010-3]
MSEDNDKQLYFPATFYCMGCAVGYSVSGQPGEWLAGQRFIA